MDQNLFQIKLPFDQSKDIDFIELNHLLNIEEHKLNFTLEDENDFIQEYETKILPERAQKEISAQNRSKRLFEAQQRIIEREENRKKQEAEEREEEYARKLQAEERQIFDRERKEKEERDRHETMIIQITSTYNQLSYENAKALLIQHKWDLQEVEKILYQQFYGQKQQEEEREMKILTLLQDFVNIDYDYARNLLQRNNWNMDNSKAEIRGYYKLKFAINLLNEQGGLDRQFQVEFDSKDSGWEILNHLNLVNDAKNKYYYIFRDMNCWQSLSYEMLSQPLNTLNIQNGSIVYAKLLSIPPF